MKKVSIIIPAYNAGKTIKKCLDSICNQTYKNIEIIVINDGSNDNTEDVVKSINNDKIIYFKKENGGVSSARNLGLDNATGDYIFFIDSDDYVNETYVENLVKNIKENDSFCLASCIKCETKDGFVDHNLTKEITNMFRFPSVTIRLFNKKYIDELNLRFGNSSLGEDLEFTTKLYIYNNNISISDDSVYYYAYSEGSLTHTLDDKSLSLLDSIKGIEDFAKEMNKYDEYYSEIEFINIFHILIHLLKNLKKIDEDKEIINSIIDNITKKYPSWKENKFIPTLSYNEREFLKEQYNEDRKKIIIYNETLISGGIEKCIELLSKSLCNKYIIDVVYINESNILDENIINIISKYANVYQLKDNEKVYGDVCIFSRLYLNKERLMNQIVANKYLLWAHSKPRALDNCVLDDKDFINKIDKIICVSECVKNEVNIPDKTMVIHNFIDNNIKEKTNETVEDNFEESNDCLNLSIVSRLSKEKGFNRVEQIIQDLIKHNINFKLKIIGKGRKYEEPLKEAFKKYKQVEFLGYKENPFPYIKKSDYLLTLSDYETWGNTISEAKSIGTPCIVTNFPSAKEQISDNINGIIIPLECDDYYKYLYDLKERSKVFKNNLKDFKYENEIELWEAVINQKKH